MALRLYLALLLTLTACSSSEPTSSDPGDDDGARDDDDDEGTAELDAGRRDATIKDATIKDATVKDATVEDVVDVVAPELDAGTEPTTEDAAREPSKQTGTLPAVSDLAAPGPFTPTRIAGPAGYVLFHPKELGKDGLKHPIFSWGPGAAENAGSFTTLLNHFASHGFVVISYDGTPDGQELVKAIDWLLAENARQGSAFYEKLDATKIAVGGHSAGSLATFRVAADKRITTTLHLCGGTFDPHTDIANLHAPALFLCGDPPVDGLLVGDVARPNCDIDFMNAKVPVVYGIPKGAAHMSPTEIGDATLRSKFASASLAWLRWQLAGDSKQETQFLGASCTLCKDASWTLQSKNWP